MNYEGIAGALALLKAIESPEEYEPGHIPQLRHVLTELAQEVISLGNLANEIDFEHDMVEEFFEEGNMGLASSLAMEYMRGDLDALKKIAEAMRGKVNFDLEASQTLREVNERRGYSGSWS